MADTDPALLTAHGERVWVSIATQADVEPYRHAMERSARRIGVWNPVNPGDLAHHLAGQSENHRTFLIRLSEPTDRAESLVGCVNVSNVVRGRFLSATMGYNAFDPHAGRGLFREGLGLVVGLALADGPAGMGLHRVEANVRLGNAASAGLLRSLGFRRERTIRRMLWLADGLGGPSAWRDHDSYAVTRDEWPAPSFAAQDASSGVLVCSDAVPEPVAVAVARELGGLALFGVPFEQALTLARLAACPVVWCTGGRATDAVRALAANGIDSALVDRELHGVTLQSRSIVQAALAVRPYLS